MNKLLSHCSPIVLASVVGASALLGFAGSASAGVGEVPWTRASSVIGDVTDNNDGTWTYDYTVSNDSVEDFAYGEYGGIPIIVDWELPWFDDAGIDTSTIFSPTGWTWAIETVGVSNAFTGWEGEASWQDPNDPFYFGDDSPFTDVTQVLHWYIEGQCGPETQFEPFECNDFNQGIFPGNTLDGFGFTAAYSETDAPYQASWHLLPIQSGDPAFPLIGPASPKALGITNQVSEPGIIGLLGIGVLGMFASLRRRKQK